MNTKETIEKKYFNWLMSDDTGTSSKTILCYLLGVDNNDNSTPLDPSDFGRCYRLLELFPELEERIEELKNIDYTLIYHAYDERRRREVKPWIIFVDNYEKMKRLYEEESSTGKCPKLYKFMNDIGL